MSFHSGDDSDKNINSFVEKLYGSTDNTLFIYWRVKCGQRFSFISADFNLLPLVESGLGGLWKPKIKKKELPTQVFFYGGNITPLLQQAVMPDSPVFVRAVTWGLCCADGKVEQGVTFKSCAIFTRAGKYLFNSQIIECEEADYRMGSTELSPSRQEIQWSATYERRRGQACY